MINPETGWGLTGETWAAMDELRAYSGGRLGWFNLGDRDLGTHLYRTTRLAEGATLSEVTAEIAARWGVAVRIVPMSDEPGRDQGGDRRAGRERPGGRLPGVLRRPPPRRAGASRPAGRRRRPRRRRPGCRDGHRRRRAASSSARRTRSCPSVRCWPTGGIGAAVAARRDRVVAVSPIIAGKALKGPADRMLAELGHEASVVGVARLWAPYAATLVIDEADAALAARGRPRPACGPWWPRRS